LKSAIKNSEIVVIPSEYEPFPFVALESLSHSKAVVASAVGGLPEIISDGFNGLMFKPRDSEDLAEKIEMLLRDKKLRRKLEGNARKSLKRFNWGNFVERMEDIYEKSEKSANG
jgi:glycosyltransferase involved in cell wall biosynthesis